MSMTCGVSTGATIRFALQLHGNQGGPPASAARLTQKNNVSSTNNITARLIRSIGTPTLVSTRAYPRTDADGGGGGDAGKGRDKAKARKPGGGKAKGRGKAKGSKK